MNAIKITKHIDSDNIEIKGLKEFIGSDAEIIILINSTGDDLSQNKWDQVQNIIHSYKGSVQSWSRDELYAR